MSRNLSEDIRNHIIGKIQQGEWPNGAKLPSESELATEFEVSKRLVNRVYATLSEFGYIVQVHGKGTFVADDASEFFSCSAKRTVFVLSRADLDPGRFPYWFHAKEINEGIASVASELGLVMAPAYVYEDAAPDFARRMHAGGNAVGFIDPTFDFPNLAEALAEEKIPFVQHCWDETKPVERAYDEYWPAMETAVSHLLATGRKRVLLLLQDEGTRLTAERRKGYALAHERFGLETSKGLEIVSKDIVKNGGRIVADAIKRGLKFDAVMAENDLCAQFLLAEFKKNGVSVPDDVAVIGSDDMPGAAGMTVPLATIRRERKKLGALFMRSLMRCSEAPSARFSTHTVEDKFVKRRSAG